MDDHYESEREASVERVEKEREERREEQGEQK